MVVLLTIIADTEKRANCTDQEKKFCLSQHWNGSNNFLFINGIKIHQFKTKDFEINTYSLCFGNISKDLTVDNMKETGLYGYVCGFSVDYESFDVDDISICTDI